MSEPERQAHAAWAGPSGLRIERLAAPRGLATLALETAPAGEPLWFSPGQWADLCRACAELGPGWAVLPAAAARPGPVPGLPAAASPPLLPPPPEITPEGPE